MEQTLRMGPKSRLQQVLQVFERAILIWEKPAAAALLTGLIFLVIALIVKSPWRLSSFPYYNYLADAFLHGQLALRLIPHTTQDLSLYQGQYYLYWGPFPAVILMPFVWVFGVGFSDIIQTLVIGAINAGIFALFLQRAGQRGLVRLEPLQRALLVIFFALGTAQAPFLVLGTVWRLAQLIAIGFSLLAYLATVSFENQKAFFWAGCAMACVLATRMSMVFVAIFLAWYLLHRHWQAGFSRLVRYCLAGIAPVAGMVLLLFLYNTARFGNPLDYGVDYHLMSSAFREIHAKYGVLSAYYIPTNLYLNFIYYPFISLRPLALWPMGGSLFLLSPLYLAAVAAVWENRKQQLTWFLVLTMVIGSIPAMMIMAPGSVSIGPRYLLDVAPPLLILTALGIRRWPTWLILVLTALSVFQYLLGTIMMLPTWA